MNRSMHAPQTWPRIVRKWAQILSQHLEQAEALAIARNIAAHVANSSLSEISLLTNPAPQPLVQQGNAMIQRIVDGEPLQYVTGIAWFLDHPFFVSPAVLIPRPETEELTLMAEKLSGPHFRAIDIGTGSGCIAISLKLRRPDIQMFAVDVSEPALEIARKNARTHQANISFQTFDILNQTENPFGHAYDIIISNPPYIHPDEAAAMEEHVLNQEPELALFTPADDPLLFYRKILTLDQRWQQMQTRFLFEINPLFSETLVKLCLDTGFSQVDVLADLSGKPRFLTAQRI